MDQSPLIHLSLLLLLLLHPFQTTAQNQQPNITLGSSLSPSSKSSSWFSPSGEFAFGFRPLETDPSLFLLAIWFNQVANKTVVWFSKPINQVGPGSKLDLTADGQLSLKDQTNQEVWTSSATKAAYAAMLDTGNFVLASSDGTVLWQSFDNPTDTILPTQVLNRDTKLVSRLMDNDYSDGRFKLSMQSDGNLVLYTIEFTTGNQYDPYFSTNTVGNGSKLVYNGSGSVYLALKNESNIIISASTGSTTGEFYQRMTLDPDGVFRQYVYPKNGTQNGNWAERRWTAGGYVPSDICQAIRSSMGSGACGFNSYCKLDENQKTVDCECPPQYSFIDPERKYKGCKPDFASQSCELDGSSSNFTFSDLNDVDWPLSDYEMLSLVNENKCRSECLADCFCAVAIFNDGSCWKKKLPLSNGKFGSYVQRKALIKVPISDNSPPQVPFPMGKNGDGNKRTWILVGSLILGSSAFLNFLLIAVIVLVYSHFSNKRVLKSLPESSVSGLSLRSFTYGELEEATNGFSEELGSGAFGIVYKGYFESEPRTCVAVKKLGKLLPDTEKEFMNEVRSIGMTHHKNLVRLLGFCNEGAERLLVYEFMSNGSLTNYLFGNSRRNWNQRIQIAMGIARGLLYLHNECVTQIVHCDIKPQNILLDDNFVARISDFGLAKLLRTDQTRTNTGIRGTRGYVAPEWFKGAGITAKVDVYSFGVMLLEIISCRRTLEQEAENEEAAVLTYWANDCYRDDRIDLLVVGDEEAMADMRRVERFVMVAIWCVQEEPMLRPTMLKVTQMLDGSAGIPVPPDPSSYISSIQ